MLAGIYVSISSTVKLVDCFGVVVALELATLGEVTGEYVDEKVY